ncbi:MAG: DUF2062 domain-containing protein [Planctomycetota bacterium]|nr:DUF2062 domain-containing protein [Planctomycetota bacterium]
MGRDGMGEDAVSEKKPGWVKRFFVKLFELNDTPERIAWGVAIGTFIGMTPTVGIQMTVAVLVATLLRGNRLAAVAMVWISNPLTIVPIYWIDYVVGALILRVPLLKWADIAKVVDLKSSGMFEQFWEFIKNLASLTVDALPAMFLGGAVLGVLLAIPAYYITLKMGRRYKKQRDGRQEASGATSSLPLQNESVSVPTEDSVKEASDGDSKEEGGGGERGEDCS